jgi:hypothetical protein
MTKKQRKAMLKRENYFLRYGYFPSKSQLAEMDKPKPKVCYGYNTASR